MTTEFIVSMFYVRVNGCVSERACTFTFFLAYYVLHFFCYTSSQFALIALVSRHWSSVVFHVYIEIEVIHSHKVIYCLMYGHLTAISIYDSTTISTGTWLRYAFWRAYVQQILHDKTRHHGKKKKKRTLKIALSTRASIKSHQHARFFPHMYNILLTIKRINCCVWTTRINFWDHRKRSHHSRIKKAHTNNHFARFVQLLLLVLEQRLQKV